MVVLGQHAAAVGEASGAADADGWRWAPPDRGPARDGLVGVYAERAMDRGLDPRQLAAARAARDGAGRAFRPAAVAGPGSTPISPAHRVGRGTAAHRAGVREDRRAAGARAPRPAVPPGGAGRGGRRLVVAGLAALLVLLGGAGAALGRVPQSRAALAAVQEGIDPALLGEHVVEAGETLRGIAAGYGISPAAVAEVNGLAEPDELLVGQRLLIPASVGGGTSPGVGGVAWAGSAAVAPGGRYIRGVPTYVQQRNLSCEYAAAQIATAALGNPVPEAAFLETVPPARNPHWGYRGNIDGWWGNTDDYGVYPEALVPTLNAYGYDGEVFYSEGDADALRQRIDLGKPVLVWLGLWGDTGVRLEDEGSYTVAAGTHVVVAYGYDAGGVHVSDPANGTYGYYPWADFTAMWRVLDGMALAVSPWEIVVQR